MHMLQEKVLRTIRTMELEEQILHIGVVITAIGVIMPWFGGQWLGDERLWTGFGFYTSYVGTAVFLIQLFLLLITFSPMLGGPILVRKSSRNSVRFHLSILSTILLLACLTVLLRVTFEVSRAEIRFGIYIALIGSIVSTLYSYLRHQEQLKSQVQELFHHPERDTSEEKKSVSRQAEEAPLPPPPPPPAPPPAEDHNIYNV